MPVILDDSVREFVASHYQDDNVGLEVRVRLDGLERRAAAQAVALALESAISTGVDSHVYPTERGTFLTLSKANVALALLVTLSETLSASGHSGTIQRSSSRDSEVLMLRLEGALSAVPTPPCAVLAFTLERAYEDGPFNESGVVEYRWGVSQSLTAQLAQGWSDWIVPANGRAVLSSPSIDVTRDDSADALTVHLQRSVSGKQLVGSPTDSAGTRLLRARDFGEVMLVEVGNGYTSGVDQALQLLQEELIPHAERLDYATVRMQRPFAADWGASGDAGHRWGRWNRHLWARYVPDPNGIQVLTDSHIAKAHDLSNWDAVRLSGGRWVVQAKDLGPWFEDGGGDGTRYTVDPKTLEQARTDFGGMILTPEVARENSVRRRRTGLA